MRLRPALRAGHSGMHSFNHDNPEDPMRLVMPLALLAVLATPVFAEPVEPTGLPVPAPSIAEFTIIQGTGWSLGSSANESLACDSARQHAISQLSKGIAIARKRQLVTADELNIAVMKPMQRVWNAQHGQCTVHLELITPVIPATRQIMIVHDRQY